MTVLKRRSRLVTFRVSADEYNTVAACCLQAGARSIAEFSRVSVLDSVKATQRRDRTLSGDLMTLTNSLAELDALLVEVRKTIRNVLGTVSADSGVPDRSA